MGFREHFAGLLLRAVATCDGSVNFDWGTEGVHLADEVVTLAVSAESLRRIAEEEEDSVGATFKSIAVVYGVNDVVIKFATVKRVAGCHLDDLVGIGVDGVDVDTKILGIAFLID